MKKTESFGASDTRWVTYEQVSLYQEVCVPFYRGCEVKFASIWLPYYQPQSVHRCVKSKTSPGTTVIQKHLKSVQQIKRCIT